MDRKHTEVRSTGGNGPDGQTGGGDFIAPLSAVTRGRLIFAAGAAGVTLHGDPRLPHLCQAHFERDVPSVRVQAGTVTIQHSQAPLTRVTLNGAIPWEIECRGGAARFIADLQALPLRALDLGSISGSVITLPQPTGIVFIYIAGSASDVTIHRPCGAAMRIHISGSASNLTFDEQHYGAVAGGTVWQSADYPHAAGRYDISIAGSASNMTIATR